MCSHSLRTVGLQTSLWIQVPSLCGIFAQYVGIQRVCSWWTEFGLIFFCGGLEIKRLIEEKVVENTFNSLSYFRISVGYFSVCTAYANLVPDFVDLQQCMAHGLFSWAGTQYVLNNQDNDIGVKVESISLAADPFFYSFERLQCKVIQATKGFPNNEECHVSLLPLSTVENISPILTLYFGCNSNVSILQLSGVMSDDSSNISPGEVFRKAWNLIHEQLCYENELELWSH